MNTASQMSVYLKEGTPEARLMVLKDLARKLVRSSIGAIYFITTRLR